MRWQGLAHLAQVWAARPDAAHLVKSLPDAQQQTLAALVSRRRQLVQMRTMERNHLGVAHQSAHTSIKAVIKSLETQIRHIKTQLTARVLSAPLGSGKPQEGRLGRVHPQAIDVPECHRQVSLTMGQ